MIDKHSIGIRHCQGAKNALVLTDYAVFSIYNSFLYSEILCFSTIRGHKSGQTFAIIVRKGDYDYA